MTTFPSVALPAFECDLPSNPNIKYRFRPFLVKEEKILLLLDSASTAAEITATTLKLIKDCCLNENFDFDALAYFDIEFLFLALRARSVGEVQKVSYTCNNMIDNGGADLHLCGNKVVVDVDFTKMEVSPTDHSNIVELDGGVKIEMRYPNQEILRDFEASVRAEDGTPPTQTEIYEASLTFVSDLIVKIITENGAIKRGVDFDHQACKDWVEKLTHPNFAKLQQFVETMPKIVIKIDFNCNKCGYHEDMVLEGLQSFFE
jgi:hypothetical protein